MVEPDVAVSPLDRNVAIAAAHDGRFPDGGAVDISFAWTHDGGATWHHSPVQGVTKAAGGIWDRASDPVVAFGPDGTAYLSILAINLHCPSAVVGAPLDRRRHDLEPAVLRPLQHVCDYSDDKNWLVVDTGAAQPATAAGCTSSGPRSCTSGGNYVERAAGGALVRRPRHDLERHPLRHRDRPRHAELAADDPAERHGRRHLL